MRNLLLLRERVGVRRRQLPEPQALVVARGEGVAAVGRNAHAVDPPLVAQEAPDFLPRLHVPEADRGIATGREDAATVRRKSRRLNPAPVPLKAAQLLAGFYVPEAQSRVMAA